MRILSSITLSLVLSVAASSVFPTTAHAEPVCTSQSSVWDYIPPGLTAFTAPIIASLVPGAQALSEPLCPEASRIQASGKETSNVPAEVRIRGIAR